MLRSCLRASTVKSVALVPVPLAFVTVIGPVVAPDGTVAVIRVDDTTLNVADVPPNRTAVVPVKSVPSIVTLVPTAPLVGENDVIVGEPAAVTVKFATLLAVPPDVVTLILPVIAPVGTTAVICVAEFTVNVVALVFLNFTSVAPVKFVPVITTEVPPGPLFGTNDVIVGAAGAVTVKLGPLVAVPNGFVTLIWPVVAPDGTVAVIAVPVGFQENVVAFVVLNLTAVVPTKFDPLIVTDVPGGPLAGEKLEIVGAHEDETVKSSVLGPEPSGVVTVILPVVAPVGTSAVIELPAAVNVVWSTPLNSTSVAPSKWFPEIVTLAPTGPHAGENELTVGAGAAWAADIGTMSAAADRTMTKDRPDTRDRV